MRDAVSKWKYFYTIFLTKNGLSQNEIVKTITIPSALENKASFRLIRNIAPSHSISVFLYFLPSHQVTGHDKP